MRNVSLAAKQAHFEKTKRSNFAHSSRLEGININTHERKQRTGKKRASLSKPS